MSDTNTEIDFSGIDFTDVQAPSFEPLPAGWYHVAVTDWNAVETKNEGKLPAGTPGINWEFTVQSGDYENRRVWENHWLHQNTLGFLKSLLAATGNYTEEQLSGPMPGFDPQDVIGAELAVKLSIRKSEQYGDSNQVRQYRKLADMPGGTGESLLP